MNMVYNVMSKIDFLLASDCVREVVDDNMRFVNIISYQYTITKCLFQVIISSVSYLR